MRSRLFCACAVVALLVCLGLTWVEDCNANSVPFLSNDAYLVNGAFLKDVPKPSKRYKIANISRTLLNEHWVMNKEGFLAAVKHYGLDGQVFAVQSEQDVIEQANILDTVVRKGYDAVIVSPISEKNLLPGLVEATKKGVIIINVDTAEILASDAKEKGITVSTYIGSNNYDAGVLAADFISEKLKGKAGKVAVVSGRPGDTCAIDRTSGFVDGVANHSNLKLVAEQSGMWDRMKALDVTTNMLRANPDIMAIYYNNDTMVLGGMQAARNLGYQVLTADEAETKAGKAKTLIIIGNDGIPEAIQKVKAGELTGTIAQKPFLMGYAAVEAAIKALEGGAIHPVIHTPIKLVTKGDM